MTAQAVSFLKTKFPEEYKKMPVVTVTVGQLALFRYKNRKKKKKTDVERYGEHLANILEWLDNNCNEPYYARFDQDTLHRSSTSADVIFGFMDETDAFAFKLMFEE